MNVENEKTNIGEEVKSETRAEAKAEAKAETRSEVRNEVKTEIRHEARHDVGRAVKNEPERKVEYGENGKEFSNILKVRSDNKETPPDERKRRVKNLAGAIAHGLRQFGTVYVRCFSPSTCYKASKAIAIARGYVAVQGFDLFNTCSFIEAEIEGMKKTGICYECFTNTTEKK